MTMLEVKDLTVRYGPITIVDHLSFHVEPGQWLMIVGPNGAGKSTIINAVSQGIPYTGTVSFDGEDLKHCKPRQLARDLGVLAQNHYVGYGFTVEEVIRLGRYAYAPGLLAGGKDESEEKVRIAIRKTGMEPFLHQSVLTLSGGELQRTFLAQLFAQDPQMLMLDEPTNHLDLVYQRQVFRLIQDWISDTGRAVVSVVHDLSLAKAFGTHALLVQRGQPAVLGEIGEVLTRERLEKTYSMDVYGWMREMYGQWNE